MKPPSGPAFRSATDRRPSQVAGSVSVLGILCQWLHLTLSALAPSSTYWRAMSIFFKPCLGVYRYKSVKGVVALMHHEVCVYHRDHVLILSIEVFDHNWWLLKFLNPKNFIVHYLSYGIHGTRKFSLQGWILLLPNYSSRFPATNTTQHTAL